MLFTSPCYTFCWYLSWFNFFLIYFIFYWVPLSFYYSLKPNWHKKNNSLFVSFAYELFNVWFILTISSCLLGSIALMFSHALTSSALFLGVGVLYDRFKTRLIFYYGGLFHFFQFFVFSIFFSFYLILVFLVHFLF